MTIAEFINKIGFKVDGSGIKDAERQISSLESFARKALGAIGITLSVAGITNAIKDCVALASEVEEMENKFNVVFQGMEDEVDQWAQSYSDAIGRNKNDIKTYLADQQNLLVGFTDGTQESRRAMAEMAEDMTSLALDLASFANTDETVAVNAMTKAVMGETEAAKTLGAVLTDVTRADAMQQLGISGTYEKLDQLTKMQVNYQAILSQSKDAVDDCKRSLGSYASTMRQFHSKQKEIKQIVGQFFLPVATKLISLGSKGLTVLRDIILRVTTLIDRLGGAEQVLPVLAAAIGATLIVMNAGKILNFINAVRKMAAAFDLAKLKIVAMFAIFLLLALVIEDFINFMQGNDSLIGALFEKAGIDADAARQTILEAWGNIKSFLLGIWDVIKEVLPQVWNVLKSAAQTIFGALASWWEQNGESVMQSFSNIWNSIKELCSTVWSFICELAKTLFGALSAFWDQWGATIISVFSIIWNTLIALIQPFLDALTAIIDFLANVFAGNWEGAWQSIMNVASAIWQMLVTIINGAWDAISTVWSAVVGFFSGIFQNIWDAISEKVTGIKDAIINGFTEAIDWIKSLPEQAVQWGSDIINGIITGITGAIGGIGDAVSGVASTISSFLHFSKPDKGPLSDFDTYMPDMIQLMVQGIQRGKETVGKAIEDLTGGMSNRMDGDAIRGAIDGMNALAGAGRPHPGTVNTVTGSNNVSRSVVQNVNINNKFQGDSAIQKQAAGAMDRSAQDVTAELARGLAFAK